MNRRLWLDPIPENLRAEAVADLERGDHVGFFIKADNLYHLDLVYFNSTTLKELGIYERALLDAFIDTRTNNHRWSLRDLRWMFDSADRARLRAAGAPLPSPGPFTLYRGVAGRGAARRVRGFSWSASFERAAWFARRFGSILHDPAVYIVRVPAEAVLTYVNDRQEEEEFVVMLPQSAKPMRDGRFREAA